MYRIAIVEDEDVFSAQLQEYLFQYAKENQREIKLSRFTNGRELIENYRKEFDIILLDIVMPEMNGMEAAEEIRRQDTEVVLMFITNMAQYAIKGYEVGALDFLMKPLSYYTFSLKFGRALKRIPPREQYLLLNLADGIKKFHVSEILYVEVQNRMLHYYTPDQEYIVRGTMQAAEQQLKPFPFVKCNHWYMVNLMHVSEVRKNIALVGGHELEISRRNRTPFLKALTEYIGGGG